MPGFNLVVQFDTCLMDGIEGIGDFADLTDFFIACPEIDYGDVHGYGSEVIGYDLTVK